MALNCTISKAKVEGQKSWLSSWGHAHCWVFSNPPARLSARPAAACSHLRGLSPGLPSGLETACCMHSASALSNLSLPAYCFQLLCLWSFLERTFSSCFKVVFPLLCRWMRCGQLAAELLLGLSHEAQILLSDCTSIFSLLLKKTKNQKLSSF